jgi:nucleotide-binding universal stress UspA family protein
MASNVAAQQQGTEGSGSTEYGILVGIDDSSGSLHALRWAANRTKRFGPIQPLVAWHYPWWAYSSASPPLAKEFEQEARKGATAAVEAVPEADILAPIVCRGQSGPSIVKAGALANLIVVGTRGRSALKDTLLGSVSSHVVAHASVPVAVVPPEAPLGPDETRIVVGVDGSENSTEALLWTIRHTPADATIEVVHSWIYPPSATPEVAMRLRDTGEDIARETLDEVMGKAKSETSDQDRPKLIGRLEYGDPRSVLNEQAQSCDMLVVGARGRGGIAHLLLGSVTSALIHQPATTTVIVPASTHR